jgi:Tol biopolymer transport system component
MQPRWSHDGRTLHFVSGDGDLMAASMEARGSRLEVKEVQTLFPSVFYVGPRFSLTAYTVRPDGKGFLANNAGETAAARVTLVQNWDAGLPR